MSRLDFIRAHRGSKCDLFEAEEESCKGCHWYPNLMPNISMCGLPNLAYNHREMDRILEELCHVLKNS